MDIQVKYATMIVRDMEESVRFYREVMGFEAAGRYDPMPGTAITLMKGKGDAMVELICDAKFPKGLYSVGMEVRDLDATLAELELRGAKITMGPAPTLVGRMAFIEDPNGVKIALIQHD
jgi:lactoylglutathione lyase